MVNYKKKSFFGLRWRQFGQYSKHRHDWCLERHRYDKGYHIRSERQPDEDHDHDRLSQVEGMIHRHSHEPDHYGMNQIGAVGHPADGVENRC